MNDQDNGVPPPHQGPVLTPAEHRMAEIIAMGFQAGMQAAMQMGLVVEVLDENERATQQFVTLPQLLQNLTNAIDDNTDVMDINNELAQEALEDTPAPRKKRKRR